MPAERLSMRKIKEVLRLKFGLGFANRQIARSCSINHSTVADYLYRAKAAGLDQWPLPDGLDEAGLEKRLFPTVAPRSEQPRGAPNWPAIHEDLQAHKHVTLQLVWQEYKQSNPDRGVADIELAMDQSVGDAVVMTLDFDDRRDLP